MTTVKIDGNKYSVPTSWPDVTLQQYVDLNSIDKDDKFADINYVSVLTGIPAEIFKQAEKTLFLRISKLMLFGNDPIKSEYKGELTINGKEFVYNGDVKTICLAQYIDIDYRADEFKDNLTAAFPYILAILYRPKGNEYNSNQATLAAKLFATLPIVEVYAATGFFLSRLKRSKKNTEVYLKVNLLLEKMHRK